MGASNNTISPHLQQLQQAPTSRELLLQIPSCTLQVLIFLLRRRQVHVMVTSIIYVTAVSLLTSRCIVQKYDVVKGKRRFKHESQQTHEHSKTELSAKQACTQASCCLKATDMSVHGNISVQQTQQHNQVSGGQVSNHNHNLSVAVCTTAKCTLTCITYRRTSYITLSHFAVVTAYAKCCINIIAVIHNTQLNLIAPAWTIMSKLDSSSTKVVQINLAYLQLLYS